LQYKIHAAGKAVNASRLNRAAHAHAMAQRGALQSLQFRDGVIVGLALAVSQPGQTGERDNDDADADPKFRAFLHKYTSLRPESQ
jgi:hypothetical protein